ncbi:hypothetical protein LUZ63_009463 [Rhynchospora breviuscula]|uniref:AB hydrolase-1 domain-containing protein n=1 Tax=Rhynchospora breviuscula TaxID=2022672 RepID=A0A9Q0CFE1_9POAL|nr:hypothetical protein LUZ63_009463 [Rhynchospora breviuscula]
MHHFSNNTMSFLRTAGHALNLAVSFIVFSILDILDIILCYVYKIIDYAIESEWKQCYCTAGKDAIIMPEAVGPKVLHVSCKKLQVEDVSDTLYERASVVMDMSRKPVEPTPATFKVSWAIAEMIRGKMDGQKPKERRIPCWSDCNCNVCNSWSGESAGSSTLYVHVEGPEDKSEIKENIVFIHGFISSSAFWTETVFPVLSETTRSSYRLFAVDLLGFGRSPKPADSLYTLREHMEMIEKSVIQKYKIKQFHIVAHSLGSVLALALAVKYPDAIKSLTLLSPPYFPVPKGEEAAASQYVMRQVAPRRVWPPIAFGASMACWYEHVSRTICLTICKHHRIWDFIFKTLTRNRMKTYLIEAFMCHTHNAAWHTLHNIICGSPTKMERYLDIVRDKLSCTVNVFHGEHDELVPVECSHAVGSKIPRACLKVYEKKDHITVIVGQERLFARELEEIWRNASSK